MQIAAQSTISASEQALRSIAAAGIDEPLQLPHNIRHLAGGAEAALTQVVTTWAQRAASPKLQTYITTKDQTADFVRRLPGLVAALCAQDATGLGGNASVFTALQAAAFARLDALQSAKPKDGYRGASAEILCVDHLGGRAAPYLLSRPDERGGASLRPRENFRDLARWLLRTSVPQQYLPMIDEEVSGDAIGSMLYELFKNTEDHARVDADGNLLGVSVRAIKTNHHAVTPNALLQIVEGFQPLASYCRSLTPPEDAAQTHLFEISILDSGPGFAVAKKKKHLSQLTLEEEEAAVRECFGPAEDKGPEHFGEGLPHVMRVLKQQRGFLRLRTGRMSFFVDFSESGEPDDSAVLRRHDDEDNLLWAPVSGSLLTVLIPMRR